MRIKCGCLDFLPAENRACDHADAARNQLKCRGIMSIVYDNDRCRVAQILPDGHAEAVIVENRHPGRA